MRINRRLQATGDIRKSEQKIEHTEQGALALIGRLFPTPFLASTTGRQAKERKPPSLHSSTVRTAQKTKALPMTTPYMHHSMDVHKKTQDGRGLKPPRLLVRSMVGMASMGYTERARPSRPPTMGKIMVTRMCIRSRGAAPADAADMVVAVGDGGWNGRRRRWGQL
jgi:hypothetical protein